MTHRRQIIALGGGGCWSDPKALIDDYVIKACGIDRPRVLFLATGVGDRADAITRFYEAFAPRECRPAHLSLFRSVPKEALEALSAQDVIYIGGGNTRSMLAVWREWGVDDLLRQAYASGTLLCGVSAGAVCWFEYALTDANGPTLSPLACLGVLKGSAAPHYDSEPTRRPAFEAFVSTGALPAGLGLDEHAAVHFVDEELSAVLASQANADVYSVRRAPDNSVESISLGARML